MKSNKRIRFIKITLAFVVFATFISYILYQNLFQNQEKQLKLITHTEKIVTKNPYYIAVVACKQRLPETLVMIKSALLFNPTKQLLRFLIFAENNLISRFEEKLNDWRELMPNQFDYEILPLHFPENSEADWSNLFKPCAAQRLFLPSLLKSVDSLLYVDTDVLFLSPVYDIWNYFKNFNTTQIAALAPEHEDPHVGWYNRFARHPFYGKLGVNSGVMLMNLTRMRNFNWESHVIPIHKEYKLRITWGDQDIINILFYYHPEKLHIMPCKYNFRPDHCMYTTVCNVTNGIKLLHGNRGYFHSSKQPLFKAIYEAIERYQLGSEVYSNFLLPLQQALEEQSIIETNCGKLSEEALFVAKKIFLNEYTYEE